MNISLWLNLIEAAPIAKHFAPTLSRSRSGLVAIGINSHNNLRSLYSVSCVLIKMKTIEWKNNKVRIIDQSKLPGKLVYLDLSNLRQLWRAIRRLKLRGAPAIGIAAAFGVVLGMRNSRARTFAQFKRELKDVFGYLKKARPTAINLFWALERMEKVAQEHCRESIPALKKLLLKEAQKIIREDKDICRRIARFGSKLIKHGDVI